MRKGSENKGRTIDLLPRELLVVLANDFDVPPVRGSVGGSLPSAIATISAPMHLAS